MEEVRKQNLTWFGHMRRSTLPIKAILEGRRTRRNPQRSNEPYTKVKDRVNRQLGKTVMRDVIRKMNEHLW